jgi:hypothetical protein
LAVDLVDLGMTDLVAQAEAAAVQVVDKLQKVVMQEHLVKVMLADHKQIHFLAVAVAVLVEQALQIAVTMLVVAVLVQTLIQVIYQQ